MTSILEALAGMAAANQLGPWREGQIDTARHRRAAAGTLPYVVKLSGRTGAYLFRREVIDLIAQQTGRRVAA